MLGTFMSLMPDAALAVDSSGHIVAMNPQAEALFAYPARALEGASIETLVPERMRTRHRQHRSVYEQNPQGRPMGIGLELIGRRQDGSEFPVDVSLAPVATSTGRLVIAAVRDRSAQRAATAAQAELASIIRSSLDAIISTTLEGDITSWNPAAERLLGYPRAEIIGEHVAVLVPDTESAVLEELLDSAYEGNQTGARDTRWRHRDGHEVDVAVSISPLRDQAGTLLGFSSVVRDVGERKVVEHELRRLLAEEERRERQHSATSEIRLALLSEPSVDEALLLICEHASELLDAPVAMISTADPEQLHVSAAVGAASTMVGTTLPVRASFSGRVLEVGGPLQVARRSEGSAVEVPPSMPDGPMLGVPILAGGGRTGALTLVRELGSPEFAPEDVHVAEGLATQAALAFELRWARQDHDQMMIVADRERIARDLHDHVIQELFATGMWLQGALPLIERQPARQRVAEAIDSLDDTIREIRKTIYDVSAPSGPGDGGKVGPAIVELVRAAEERLGFLPALHFEGPIDTGVPPEILPHVLAVVREGLSNVARHAAARSVRIEVSGGTHNLRVTISDDGVGLGERTRSSGLANLEERARLLGGSFQVLTRPEGGTRLDWEVPVAG